MAILKEDTTIEATSGVVAASAAAPTMAPEKKARTTSTKAKLGASRGFTKTTGVSKNWKIAVPVIALLGAGVFLAGGHYLANYIIDNGKLTEQIGTKSENGKPGTGLLGDNEKLEGDKEDLKGQLDEAKKPTTVVFDENQIAQVSSALIANKGIPGKFTGLRAQHFDVETNVLTLYFDGIEGGKEVVYSTQVKFKDSKFTSKDAKLALEEQKPMCQIYKSVEEFKLNAGVYDAAKQTSLVKISSAMDDSSTEIITIDDIKMEITISRNSARKTAKVSYKALLVDGDKLSVVDEGVISVDYNTTDAEANSIVVQNFVRTYGAQASAQMIEDEEM